MSFILDCYGSYAMTLKEVNMAIKLRTICMVLINDTYLLPYHTISIPLSLVKMFGILFVFI